MKKKYLDYLIVVLMTISPIVLILMPKDYFDDGQVICPSKLILNIDCLGCGMTRACMKLIHLDVNGAMGFNKLSIIVFPILVFLYIQYLFKKIDKLKK